MTRRTTIARALGAALAVLAAAGCTNGGMLDFQRVQPWEKGKLAKDSMRPTGDPVDSYVDEHTYFSKEASTGGAGVGAGGCGCN